MAEAVTKRPADLPAGYENAGPTTLAVLGLAEVPELDPKATSERITRAMLGAESAEDLIAAGQTWSFKDLLGVPIEAHSVVLQRSTKEGEGLDVYMLIEANRLDNGEPLVISTSGENIVHRLAIANDRGWLPFKFKVEKTDEPTARGFSPYIVKSV